MKKYPVFLLAEILIVASARMCYIKISPETFMYNTYTHKIIQVGLVNIYLRMSKTITYEK